MVETHKRQVLRRARDPRDRTQVVEVARARMIAAAIDVVELDGYAGLTITKVIARAKVSHKTFGDVFLDREDCFLAAFEQTLARAYEIARAAYAGERDWRDGMRAGAISLLRLMDRERGLARLCLVEALVAGPRVLDRRARGLQALAQAIDGGRAYAPDRVEPQPLVAQMLAEGVVVLVNRRLRGGHAEPLSDLLRPLMSMIVMPYLGPKAAREELDAPSPKPRRGGPTAPSCRERDSLERLDMRLTRRTAHVLTVIAGSPGVSNRQIAQGAGVVDQGQISKLLRRLAGLGLIENVNTGKTAPHANAWRLTPFGAEVQRAALGCR